MFYFNTAFSLSMIESSATLRIFHVSACMAKTLLKAGLTCNVANPNHANTLCAVSALLGIDVSTNATGSRVTLESGDSMLVAQVVFPQSIPRETTEYTQEMLDKGKFTFQLVRVL